MSTIPSEMSRINFINTNRCNLRCVYCPQGSHPDEYHADLTADSFEEIYNFVVDHKIKEAGMGYYGEITMIDNWWQPVRRMLDAGVLMSTTTNGSTVLSPDEVATFARFKYIEWSIDTYDQQTLKAVRKKVDVRTIVHNYHLVRSYCLLHDVPMPEIRWTGVLTVDVVEQMPQFVAYASSNGVKKMNFNEVAVYEGAPAKGLSVVDQADDEAFERSAKKIDEALSVCKRLGIEMTVSELTRIAARRRAIANGEKYGLPLFRTSSPVADVWTHNEEVKLPPGYTRDCRLPWEEFYLNPKGEVFVCCTRGDVMGVAKTKAELEDVLTNDKYQKLRTSLETGVDLDPACANCLIKGAKRVAPEPEAEAPAPAERPAPWFKRLWSKAA
jgi:MoaA/NifB/PqqE/SkfB family radical SAM enzyme